MQTDTDLLQDMDTDLISGLLSGNQHFLKFVPQSPDLIGCKKRLKNIVVCVTFQNFVFSWECWYGQRPHTVPGVHGVRCHGTSLSPGTRSKGADNIRLEYRFFYLKPSPRQKSIVVKLVYKVLRGPRSKHTTLLPFPPLSPSFGSAPSMFCF